MVYVYCPIGRRASLDEGIFEWFRGFSGLEHPGGIDAAQEGVLAMKSTMTSANSGPQSSWRKWPPPLIVVWG